ncbi:hypothetical protein M3398_00455 [Streptomyces albidoflavus]|uniref:hypothetical protein n=1 Tax=Streptomyces TaxID=1883 RepID=UPI0020BDE94D|nr:MULTISPECIES: hypothetical protein [Streptomyces]MCL6275777.1 hypothetical protein [Streptomyces albidoflavus]MCX4466095.1 hypothetical protein [Streptomyces albidoflavus]MDI3342995.1 hypothetical protein [Streptomyces sp. AJ-1]WSI92530.1 hypothetical protein OG695_11890 [Streptomyces albidoflavus]
MQATGDRSGTVLTSQITYSGNTGGGGGSRNQAVTPVGDWTPPACWYEPRTAKEFAKYMEDTYDSVVNMRGQHSYAKTSAGQTRQYYKDGEYKNYNLKKSDEGLWWVAVRDEDRWMEEGAKACSEPPAWVENGETPDLPNAVTPEVLAQLAYDQIRVPDTEVSLAPGGASKVNLPTWAWLDRATFKPVEVTASLVANGVNISATTVARPDSLALDPGTPDATLHPASGECGLSGSGSVGEPYAKGKAGQEPPCGVTYLRASGKSAYDLNATVNWKIGWTGTGQPEEQALPDGAFGAGQDVVVEEIQSVNR